VTPVRPRKRRKGGVLATVGQGIGDALESFQLCWLIDKAGEEGRDRHYANMEPLLDRKH